MRRCCVNERVLQHGKHMHISVWGFAFNMPIFYLAVSPSLFLSLTLPVLFAAVALNLGLMHARQSPSFIPNLMHARQSLSFVPHPVEIFQEKFGKRASGSSQFSGLSEVPTERRAWSKGMSGLKR